MSSMAADESSRVGWIGLGSMGLAMAQNIQKHLKATGQPSLCYWNRTISKGEELKNIGGEPYNHAIEVAWNCRVTFISVSHDRFLTTIYTDLLAGQR
jgi:3-hydroxyisobutyrate dehydrogenase-like beta-hydroxyacid dehydrogenase